MKQYKPFSDERFDARCTFCGGQSDSRDHIPARVFLQRPYPDNLHVVPACNECNNALSKDEEYISFLTKYLKFLETQSPNDRAAFEQFSHADVLEDRILKDLSVEHGGRSVINIETDKVLNIIKKYAFAHYCYECSEQRYDNPTYANYAFRSQLSMKEIASFDTVPAETVLPELGSRLFQRVLLERNSWMVVQPNRYRYFISQGNPIVVKMVFDEFLFAEVIWED